MGEKILLVEDEAAISELLQLYLIGEDYEVLTAKDGEEAFTILEQIEPDLAILDLMLPDINGMEICQSIRKKSTYPILILTARNDQIDKIKGLNTGADDYITKPFKPLEVVARVKANLRRYKEYDQEKVQFDKPEKLQIGDVCLDSNEHTITIDGKKCSLTPKEFGVLELLMTNQGRILNAEDIFFKVWGEEYYESANNTVMVHIRHLRKKIGKLEGDAGYIRTVWGVGYIIDA